MNEVKGFKYNDEVYQYNYEDLLNKPNTDKTLKTENAFADAKAAGSIVKVSSTQPTEASNKIWVEPEPTMSDVTVPTMEDMSALDEAVDELKSALTLSETLPIEAYLHSGVYINRTSGKWSTDASNACYLYPVNNAKKYLIAGNSGDSSLVAFLTSNQTSGQASFSSDLSWNGVVILGKNGTIEGDIPADANYLYVFLATGHVPSAILIDNENVVNSPISEVTYDHLMLSNSVDSFINYGDAYFNGEQFTVGVITSTGEFKANIGNRYRMVSSILLYDRAIRIYTADSNYRFYILYYNSSGNVTDVIGWQTDYIIPSNQRFRIQIAKISSLEDTSSIADVAEFVDKVRYSSFLKDKINSVKQQNILYSGNHTTVLDSGATSKSEQIATIQLNNYGISAGDTIYIKVDSVSDYVNSNIISIDTYNSSAQRKTINYYTTHRLGSFAPVILPSDTAYVIIVSRATSSVAGSSVVLTGIRVCKYASEEVTVIPAQINKDATIAKRSLQSGIMSIMHGATTAYPANTLGMFRKAYQLGIMYWECDIRKCLDGYVLCHDNDIYNHAVTNGGETISQNTVLISQSTVAQLKQYKFGVITGHQSDGVVTGFENETIPTLQEYLQLAKVAGAIPILEIKYSATESEFAEICNIVKTYGLFNDSYIFITSNVTNFCSYAIANHAKKLIVAINDGVGSEANIDTVYSLLSQYFDDLDDVMFDMTKETITFALTQYAAQKRMRTCVYPVFETATDDVIFDLWEKGATGFITNKPNVAEIIARSFNLLDI